MRGCPVAWALPGRAGGGPSVDGAAGRVPAGILPDGRARVLGGGLLQGGDGTAVGMDELAGMFGGHRADVRVRVAGQVPQCGPENLACSWCAGVAFAPVAGQGVERGDPDAGIEIVGHGDQLAHGVGVDEVVVEAAAALADGRIAVMEAGADRAGRVLAAS